MAEQFQNVLDANKTETFVTLLPFGISTETPPPQLMEGEPLAPIATTTEQLLNDDNCRFTFANATLLAYTAPPPPLAALGTTDVELVTAEHAVKLQLDMENVTLNPANFGIWKGCSTPPRNEDTWGECSRDKAPPYTEAVPRAGPPVNETALQSANELPVTETRQSCIEVVPNDVETNAAVVAMLLTNAPVTMATAPPIACLRVTSNTERARVIIAAHDARWSLTTSLRSNRVSTISHAPKRSCVRNV